MGIDAAIINKRAFTAALVKNACSVAHQIEVAKVLKPIGLRRRVAGNSFMASRNTMEPPARRPGTSRGSVIVVKALSGVLPKIRAASSSLGLICRNEVFILLNAPGKNKIP